MKHTMKLSLKYGGATARDIKHTHRTSRAKRRSLQSKSQLLSHENLWIVASCRLLSHLLKMVLKIMEADTVEHVHALTQMHPWCCGYMWLYSLV